MTSMPAMNTLSWIVFIGVMLIVHCRITVCCKIGAYGYGCNETCGMCFSGKNSCSVIDGQCTLGCEAGWQGGTCKQECKKGTYGHVCNETCGMCFGGNISCSTIKGQCLLGCEAGWWGTTCKQECDKGAYGYGCNESCGMCFSGNNSCSSIDGQCKIGCEAGWQGVTCKEACRKGTYGYGCNSTCGMCLNGNYSCSTIDGECKLGCKAGWRDKTCTHACENGTYGRECAEICGNCLKGTSSCSTIDGLCIDGCECGWRGETCKIDSSEKQMQSYPSVNATAIGGSVGGVCVIAIIVNIITVIVLKRRMNKNSSNNEIQMGKVNHDTDNHYLNLSNPSTGNFIQSVIGGDNAREGFQTGDTEYETIYLMVSQGTSKKLYKIQTTQIPEEGNNKNYKTDGELKGRRILQ